MSFWSLLHGLVTIPGGGGSNNSAIVTMPHTNFTHLSHLQEEGVLGAECGQVSARLGNLEAEQQGLAAVVDELARRKVGPFPALSQSHACLCSG